MKRIPIVILDEHKDATPADALLQLAERLNSVGYDALPFESTQPSFDAWASGMFGDARLSAIPRFFNRLSDLIVYGKMKYIPIDRLRPVEESEALSAMALEKRLLAALSDPTKLLDLDLSTAQNYLNKFSAGTPAREASISRDFNQAFHEFKGCITLFGAAHLETIYRGFIARYPEHARNIKFIYFDKSRAIDKRLAANPHFMSPHIIASMKKCNAEIKSDFKRLAIPEEQVIIIDVADGWNIEDVLCRLGPDILHKDISLPANQAHPMAAAPPALPAAGVPPCTVCSSPGILKCICAQRYCSAVCQKAHWPIHKHICTGKKK